MAKADSKVETRVVSLVLNWLRDLIQKLSKGEPEHLS
jgi:hypothetical protein